MIAFKIMGAIVTLDVVFVVLMWLHGKKYKIK